MTGAAFDELLRRLVAAEVRFVLVGGFAVNAWGVVRGTKDLDIVADPEPDNFKRLAEVAAAAGGQVQTRDAFLSSSVSIAALLAHGERVQIDTDLGPLDVVQGLPGVPPYAELRPRATDVEIVGVTISVCSLEDLRSMKRAAGRTRDLADLEELEIARGDDGRAARWGRLWGARAADWAENEEQQAPTYEEAIRRVGLATGQRVLDVGCGSGVFLRLAADRGAQPFGLDASGALIELAAERVPEAELRVGEMENLPYDDDSFDLVTGFNSFFFAADLAGALREAGRVAKPGAAVLIQVWGPPERCDLEAMKQVARRYAPPPPPNAPPAPRLSDPGVLEALAGQAGLSPEEVFDLSYAFAYRDAETLTRLMMAPMGLAELAGRSREPALRREIVEALSAYRASDGSYRLQNEFHFLLARAGL